MNTNLDHIDAFIFEIPFTKSGKAHGEMADQYKRKTILVVEAAFPHLKKRLKVIDKREIEACDVCILHISCLTGHRCRQLRTP